MKTRPNIVFILTDDQGAWAMRCAGNPDIHTPNIDALAANGARLNNFFCASPVCSPARASIVTGKIPSRHGILDWLSGGNVDSARYPGLKGTGAYGLSKADGGDTAIDYLSGHTTYIELLHQNGYNCAHSGKWHLGDNAGKKPGFNRGYFTIGAGGCGYFAADVHENGAAKVHGGYITDLITDKALEYMNGMYNEPAPFYIGVHYTAPHSPWDAGNHQKEYLDIYKDSVFAYTPARPVHPWQVQCSLVGDTDIKRRDNITGYYAAVTAMDAGIGRIVADLRKNDKLDNTLIIFTSDNGMNLGQHGVWGKGNGTYPQNMYDTSVKVPFVARLPGVIEGGRVQDGLAGQTDLFHTILDIADVEYTKEESQPGRSFAPMLTGGDPGADAVYVYNEYARTRMVRTKNFKYIRRYMDNALDEFYDLTADPGEDLNMIGNANYAREIKTMNRQLTDYFAKYADSRFDGSKFHVNGSGQSDFPGEDSAFGGKITHYYPNYK